MNIYSNTFIRTMKSLLMLNEKNFHGTISEFTVKLTGSKFRSDVGKIINWMIVQKVLVKYKKTYHNPFSVTSRGRHECDKNCFDNGVKSQRRKQAIVYKFNNSKLILVWKNTLYQKICIDNDIQFIIDLFGGDDNFIEELERKKGWSLVIT